MGRKKAVADDLLADIPNTVNAQPSPSQSQPKPKPKRLEKAQPKATVTQIDTEDTFPISKITKAEKSASAVEKRPAEHGHFFVMQAFNIKKELANKTKEVVGLQKAINKAEAKMKTLMKQAEEAKKAQKEADERTGAAEAIAKVFEGEKKEAEGKTADAQAELITALATKDAEIKAADKKAYAEGVADVKEDYKRQVR
ncbi:uncharacterized protein LOC114303706 [Camellia sinensis]|uniref:uncharacterized protein LOC114303706 n=1 Tax=Camellia sinensis TaxID=4442 RepID=UPI00103674F7|nr:uncharacterized protein LOC114303706 [Camellia sinensis]